MKKYLATAAVMIMVVFAVPASAATNPFMDVPRNHWAFDAINQLSSLGVLSGLPDGTFKGRQPSTRYEVASALARALAVVDMSKARKQDVELMKRLIVEFKDELDALGVKADVIDERLGVLENGLRGWTISGSMALDLNFVRQDEGNGYFSFYMARLFLDRRFGENEEIHFHVRIEGANDELINFDRFFVEFPAWFDTKVTVGRFGWDWEEAYNFYTLGVSDLGVWSFLTDRPFLGYGITKQFGLGRFQMYAQRPSLSAVAPVGLLTDWEEATAWELAAVANLQFTEQLGVDLGIQAFLGDNGSVSSASILPPLPDVHKFKNMTTLFGGLRFDFNDNVGLRGIYYHQKLKGEDVVTGNAWDTGNTHAYRVLFDVKQEVLGFTSLWLAYDFMKEGFVSFNDGSFEIDGVRGWNDAAEMKTWRVGAIQQWNDQWRSWVYFAHHTLPRYFPNAESMKGTQWGVGMEYRRNPNLGFALNYVNSRFNERAGEYSPGKNHLIRFRTQVDF